MEDVRLTKKQRRALAKEEKRKVREKRERSKKLKKWSLSLVIILGLAFAGYKFVSWYKTPIEDSDIFSQEVSGVSTENEWVKGNPEARVTLVEYSDFQCPACAGFSEYVERLSEDFSDDLKIIYRHFPLESIHDNAFAAARAAEAAGKQGMFWQMHDILFERQTDWSDEAIPGEKFAEYAVDLELDEVKFIDDFESDSAKQNVKDDLTSAQQLGLNSTPTFLLNNEVVRPNNYDEFKELIETQIRGYTIE